MPGFDQIGPRAHGALTGRRMGRCTDSSTNLKNQTVDPIENQTEDLPDFFKRRSIGFGRARGRCGRGFGLGQQNRFRNGS